MVYLQSNALIHGCNKTLKVYAHPHICNESVAIVHNGIIENHSVLREQQKAAGYIFTSDTDTEVAVHQVDYYLKQGEDLLSAVKKATTDFEGAYALGVISVAEPGRLIATRSGSPLVIGLGLGEHFIASDASALLPVTRRFISPVRHYPRNFPPDDTFPL